MSEITSSNGAEVKSSEISGSYSGEIASEGDNSEKLSISDDKFSMELAQSEVRGYHQKSINQILESNSKYMYDADLDRVSKGVEDIRVIEYDAYLGRSGAYLSNNGEGSIEVSAITKEQMERSTIHETNHFASKNRELRVEQPHKNGYTVYQAVGIREATWFHSYETGEIENFEIRGKGLNEGLTTMYTNEQLREISPLKAKAAEREGIYPHATELSKQLENIVGEDVLKKAYYGGNLQGLEQRVDELAGKNSYKELSESFDLTLSDDYIVRMEAMGRAQEILARMYEGRNKQL